MINQIREAIHKLLSERCERSNLIIAVSPLVEIFFLDEIYTKYLFNPNTYPGGNINKFEGVEVYNKHPYNEICIYDSKNSAYFQELIIVIKFDVKQKQFNRL